MAMKLIEQSTILNMTDCIYQIYNALNNKGVNVELAVPVSDYPNKIMEIKDEPKKFYPDHTWWDIEKIMVEDFEYTYTKHKAIVLLTDAESTTNLFGADFYRTSDGGIYTSDDIHTWDPSQDKETDSGYKTRWIMYYFRNEGDFTYCMSELSKSALYIVGQNLKPYNINISFFTLLRAMKFTELTSYITYDSLKNICYGNNSLEFLAEVYVPGVTGEFTDAFAFCQNLRVSPVIGAPNSEKFNGMYQGCVRMEMIPELSMAKATSAINMFQSCYNLMNIKIVDFINCSVSFSQSPLNKESALRLIAALIPKIGGTKQTLTLNSSTYNRLSDVEIAVATAKNWEIVSVM